MLNSFQVFGPPTVVGVDVNPFTEDMLFSNYDWGVGDSPSSVQPYSFRMSFDEFFLWALVHIFFHCIK